MFLFLTTCLFWTSVFGQHEITEYAEVLPPKGQCAEGKSLGRHDCELQWIYLDGLCEDDCWGGTEYDLPSKGSAHGCGCIMNEDGKLYYNDPSGKACNAGKEVSMICKKEKDVETCEDIDGWNVQCNSSCGSSSWYPSPEFWDVHDAHGNIDTSHFTIAECAALCVDDCVAFQMEVDGCGYFYSGLQFSKPETVHEGLVSSQSSCVSRTPYVEGDCADYDAGEGWAVDCGHYCERFNVDGRSNFGFSNEVPWTTGVSIAECAELCEADGCDHFNYNPQNGGACQFFNETLAEPGFRVDTDGACVFRESVYPGRGSDDTDSGSDGTDSGSDDTDNSTHFKDCPDTAAWEVLQCWEKDAEGNYIHHDVVPKSTDELTKDEVSDALCVWFDDWFSEGGCCEDCNPCLLEGYKAVYREAGFDVDCESEDDLVTKIQNGDFSSLTTLELVGIGAGALVLLSLLVGISCCCCKCTNGKQTTFKFSS